MKMPRAPLNDDQMLVRLIRSGRERRDWFLMIEETSAFVSSL